MKLILMSKRIVFSSIILIISISIFYISNQTEDISHIKLLPYELKGNNDSNVLAVFLHGYPNHFRMWDSTIRPLENELLTLSISYPNFFNDVKLNWGLTFEQLIPLIKDTIDHVERSSNKKFKKILISHDWGALIGYFYDIDYPKYFDQIVTLDVGLGSDKISDKIHNLAYQSFLATSFLIGGKVGHFMTKLIVKYYFEVWGLTPNEIEDADSSINYFYYYFLKNPIKNGKKLKSFKPSVPLTFVYGKDKSSNFHSDSFLELIKSNGGEVIEVSGDHWVMEKHHKLISDKIREKYLKFI